MKTNNHVLKAAAVTRVDVGGFTRVLDTVGERIGGCFARAEPRRRVVAVLGGLLGSRVSRNGWSIAEQIGESSPDGVERLLNKAVWDQEHVLAEARRLVVEQFADPAAVLAIDETGDQKKGVKTIGTHRQYSGTCGRVENCQISVCASYVTPRAHTLIDAQLYLPRAWCDDAERLDEAGVPDHEREFKTKPQIASDMVQRAITAAVPFGWMAADEVYGCDSRLRGLLRENRKGYVLAVASHHQVTTPKGHIRIDRLITRLPPRAWTRLSAGAGTRGFRLYDWTLVDLAGSPDQIMARRNRRTGELAYYRCWAPCRTPLTTLVTIAGSRWPIETDFQTSKNECGLDEHQVRKWLAYRRWLVLVITAHAILTVTTALARDSADSRHRDHELIPLTIPETRRLLQALILNQISGISHRLHWSRWRRRRQAQAKRCHYQRQELTL